MPEFFCYFLRVGHVFQYRIIVVYGAYQQGVLQLRYYGLRNHVIGHAYSYGFFVARKPLGYLFICLHDKRKRTRQVVFHEPERAFIERGCVLRKMGEVGAQQRKMYFLGLFARYAAHRFQGFLAVQFTAHGINGIGR